MPVPWTRHGPSDSIMERKDMLKTHLPANSLTLWNMLGRQSIPFLRCLDFQGATWMSQEVSKWFVSRL